MRGSDEKRLTIQEVADYLRVDHMRVKELIWDGSLRPEVSGRRVRIRRGDLRPLIENR
jgi:excisionase family DNA binding protein